MIDLVSTADQLEVVTTGTVTFDVICSFVDSVIHNRSTVLGRQATAIIAAGTAIIVSPPASGAERGLKSVFIRNKHATQSTPTTVQTNIGGIVTPLWVGTLNASETLQYNNSTGMFERLAPKVWSNVQSFTAGGSYVWTKPTTFTPHTVVVVIYGAGGGGSAANSEDSGSTDGGSGGGGGAYVQRTYLAADLADNVPLIVGFGGEGGVGATSSQSLQDPTAGQQSSFGQGKLKVFAGAGGAGTGGGVSQDVTGGGGGGTGGSGTAAAASASGLPGLGTLTTERRGGSGGRGAVTSLTTYAEAGGGAGGQIQFATPTPDLVFIGGTSIFGGAGGGAGSTWDLTAFVDAATGGVPNTCHATGAAGGAAAGTSGAAPTAGANGADGHAGRGGGGGGGGGGTQTAATNGAPGGKGGYCGGGGGGGGCCLASGRAGDGGNGGDGAVFVFTY